MKWVDENITNIFRFMFVVFFPIIFIQVLILSVVFRRRPIDILKLAWRATE